MNKNFSGSSFFRQTTLILLFILVFPFALLANGKKDIDAEYEDQLNELTERICTSLENKEINADQAKSQLNELRLQYRKEYTDESGKMDSLIDDLSNGEITSEQALNMFGELEQLRLRERERIELQLEEQKREEKQIQEQSREEKSSSDRDSQNSDSNEKKSDSSSTSSSSSNRNETSKK